MGIGDFGHGRALSGPVTSALTVGCLPALGISCAFCLDIALPASSAWKLDLAQTTPPPQPPQLALAALTPQAQGLD